MPNYQINNLNLCCGCNACSLICNKKAIVTNKTNLGFIKNSIDKSICISCGACKNVCPIEKKVSNNLSDTIFLYRTNDEKIYCSSSSGGVFDSLSKFIFSFEKAVCFGVKYDSNMKPIYACATSYEDTFSFRGSKYIFASIGKDVYESVKDYLLKGYYVLFSGNPCVISAIKNYLEIKKINLDRLYTLDFVCHGVGSPFLWEKQVAMIEKKAKARLINYEFRYKANNKSHSHHIRATFDNNKQIVDKPYFKIYQNIYFKNVIMQEACYSCNYANKYRVSDLTMGDNKGYNVLEEDVTDYTNSSIVIPNDEKGEILLKQLSNTGFIKTIKYEDVIQPHLSLPTQRPVYYSKFWKDFKRFGLFFVAIKYGSYNPISIFRQRRNGSLIKTK